MKLNKLNWEVGSGTDAGYVRKDNHDRMSWATVPWGQLYIISDGLSGYKGGAQAAELTIQGLERYLASASKDIRIEDAIRDAFDKTNKDVYEKSHSGDPATEGMAATAVILLISGQIAKIAHVGNCRAYLHRDGKLHLLTKDHTQFQRFVDAGMIKPEETRNHPSANILERAIGHRPRISMGIGSDLILKEGDGILLCTDGLSGYSDDREIETAINHSSTPQEVVNRLINLALKNGGEDNITVQFVKYGKSSAVSHSNYNDKVKFIFWGLLIVCFAAGASLLTYTLVKHTAEENAANLRKTITQIESDLIKQANKIKELDKQVVQLNVNLSDRNLEIANIQNAERQAANQVRKLEKQLDLEIRAKKRLENKLKSITKEKKIAEKEKLIAKKMVKKLEEKESILKKNIRILETKLQLLYLRSPVNGKDK